MPCCNDLILLELTVLKTHLEYNFENLSQKRKILKTPSKGTN